jgi:hypothetical protein
VIVVSCCMHILGRFGVHGNRSFALPHRFVRFRVSQSACLCTLLHPPTSTNVNNVVTDVVEQSTYLGSVILFEDFIYFL